MKFIKLTTVLCVSLLILTSCKNPFSGNLDDSLTDEKFELGEEFKIGFDKTITNNEESIQITFANVLKEERCYADVMCAWAGNAKIGINIIYKEQVDNIELDTHNKLINVANFESYSVRLVKLDPYPQSSQKSIPEREYAATLLVERNN